MRDGSRYEGEFVEGEITGKGERVYADGTIYKGEFLQGEKHGYGEVKYAKGREDWYKGMWQMNVREGQGTLYTKDKNTFTGEFRGHHPNGVCTVLYNNGSHYHGEVVKGVKHGQGKLSTPVALNIGSHLGGGDSSIEREEDEVNVVYDGTFENGLKHGQGRLFIENGSFSLESKFVNDQPEHESNQTILRLPHAPVEEETKVDPKAKKPDPKAAAKPEEDKEKENKNKITYEVGKENNAIEFEMHIVYQGQPYEDPNPPVVEEKQAAPAKGGKGPAKPVEETKPEIRMITPDPVLMINESGRTFEFELGRIEKVAKNNEASVGTLSGQEGADEEVEMKWITYKFNQQGDSLVSCSHQVHHSAIVEAANQLARRCVPSARPQLRTG